MENLENTQERFDSAEDMIRETEMAFRKSISTIRDWGRETLDTVREKPESVMVAAGISGVIAGSLIRRSVAARREGKSMPTIDPSLILAGGLLLGALLGPRLMETALALFDEQNEEPVTPRPLTSSRGKHGSQVPQSPQSEDDPVLLRATGSMNERPFEKI